MKALKTTLITILTLVLIQAISFYAIAEKLLVKEIGENFESFVLPYNDLQLDEIGIVSNLDLTSDQIKESFITLERYANTIRSCKTFSECIDLARIDEHYLYGFSWEKRNPFLSNIVVEGEKAKEFGASWESKYVWVLFKWVLLDKENTGIS
ncbi:MAG: hypothetical protein COA58_09245 [Bacteroidetes bacterium]|nr:MAG: hypothetical protein COA58_09245 [Bacteroidota bacterium]